MSFPERGMLATEGPLPARDLFPDVAWEAKLAIAPGTVYGNAWEQRRTNSVALRVEAVPYSPPFTPLDTNPRCYLNIRSAGVSLGRVVFELRVDAAPVACENFLQLCTFGVYKGAIFHRIFADFVVQGGDYHRRCSVVCPPDSPGDCFDLSQVAYAAGGRSIYSDRPDGLFADESSPLKHTRGSLSMSNSGRKDTNGSQFFITITPESAPPSHLDGNYTVFGQVVEGFDVCAALGSVGRKDGTTLQRVVCEECGVLPARQGAQGVSAALRRVGGRPARAVTCRAAARGRCAAASRHGMACRGAPLALAL